MKGETMSLQIDNLDPETKGTGIYVLLADYGPEGHHVIARGHTVEEVYSKQGEAYGSPVSLVKLVDLVIEELDPVKVREAEYYE